MNAPALKSPNFKFLGEHDPQLLEFAARAENSYVSPRATSPASKFLKMSLAAECL